MDIVCITSDF